jgi:hypothetical protein
MKTAGVSFGIVSRNCIVKKVAAEPADKNTDYAEKVKIALMS